MKHDPVRDEMNYRGCVDLLDPHAGIGEITILDMIETPVAVMRQGAAAADEIRSLRLRLDRIEAAAQAGDLAGVISQVSGRRQAEANAEASRIERLDVYQARRAAL
jgi:hypothetical protein